MTRTCVIAMVGALTVTNDFACGSQAAISGRMASVVTRRARLRRPMSERPGIMAAARCTNDARRGVSVETPSTRWFQRGAFCLRMTRMWAGAKIVIGRNVRESG